MNTPVDTAEETADSPLDGVQTAVAELQREAVELFDQLAPGSGLFEEVIALLDFSRNGVAALRRELMEPAAELAVVAGGIPPLMDDVVATLGEFQTGMESLLEGAVRLETQIGESFRPMNQMRADVLRAVSDLEQGASEEIGELLEEVDNLMEQAAATIAGVIDTISTTVGQEVLDPIDNLIERNEAAIEDWVGDVTTELLPAFREEVVDQNIERIRRRLDEVMDTIRESLEQFRDGIAGGTDQVEGARGSSQRSLELLRAAFDPVLDELERVRGLAASVHIAI